MAQPEINGVGLGNPAMLFGSDGAKWIAALIDALGHLQVDIVTSVLSTVLASIDGKDFATQTTLAALAGEDFATQTTLALILAKIAGVDGVSSSLILAVDENIPVQNATWTTVVSYTVTSQKTLYVTDFIANCIELAAGVEFLWLLNNLGVSETYGRVAAGHSGEISFNTPIACGSGTEVRIRLHQFSGAAKLFSGAIIGFEV